jgi:hypothetical protein
MQKDTNRKHPGHPQQKEKPNIRMRGIDKKEDFQLKGPVNTFNKIMEENIPKLKREMHINIEEA